MQAKVVAALPRSVPVPMREVRRAPDALVRPTTQGRPQRAAAIREARAIQRARVVSLARVGLAAPAAEQAALREPLASIS